MIVVDDVYVDESRPFARFTVRLTEPSTQPVSVSYNNANETAANGSDYVAKGGTLTFAPGQTSLTVDIPLIGNSTLERTESFLLNLFSPVNATIATPFARATIFDNDQPSGTPVARVANTVVDEAAGTVAFVVTLDRPSTGTVSVVASTASGTASAGSDYTSLTQTLSFAPGETVKVVNVKLTNDTTAEAAEWFDLKLSSPSGVTLLPQPSGRATIGANDAAPASLPRISVSDAVADESSTYAEFVVSLSAPSTQTVSVSYNNSNLTAANGSDYLARGSTITFLAGETTKLVKIPLLDTTGAEPPEMLLLNLFSPVNATIARPHGYATIVDNDASPGTPLIRVSDQVVDEASGRVSFVITLDRPSTGIVSVNAATASGSASAGSDYQSLPTQTLSFLPGEMVKVVDVGLVNDTSAEAGEYFDLKLSSAVGATLADTNARAFIAPSDGTTASQPRITVADASADESEAAMQFVVNLSAPSTQAVTVSYNNSNLTAANGSDYLAQGGSVTFAPGETTKLITIPLLGGLAAEAPELLRLNLFSPVNATIARANAIGTIVDNDGTAGTPSISVSDGIADESQPRAAFTVSLDKPSTSVVRVNYATAAGNAAAGSDYETQGTQTLVFAAGETSKTVWVNLRGDSTSEGPEFFDLVLSSAVNASIGDSRGHMAIAQSDAATSSQPVIQAAAIAAPENGTYAEFIVSLSAPSTQVVSVSYNNGNATAANGSDYLALGGVVTFQPGETLHTVRIPLLDNTTAESTESFNLNLFAPVNALVGTSTVSMAIIDNDGAPPASQFVNIGTANSDILVGRPGSNSVSGGSGNDLLDGVNGVAMSGGSGNDVYIVESSTDKVTESGGGTDTVVAYVSYTLGSNVEKLILRGSAASGTGNTLANTITGNNSANTLNGRSGADTITGSGGNDTLVFDSLTGFDTVLDWKSVEDTLRFSMAGVPVGDGDTVVEGGAVRSAPGGFSTAAEVVIFTSDISGSITAASAAAKIGSATSAYAAGAHALFTVDNGTQSGVFLFTSSGADALVSAAELTQVALLNGDATGLADYTFGV